MAKKKDILDLQELFNEDIKTDVLVGLLPEGTEDLRTQKQIQEKVDKYMNGIRGYLNTAYGAIDPSWELTLELLEDNLYQYFEYKNIIKQAGVFNFETYRKNPLISTLKDIQATIIKQVLNLGLSPYAKAKIKITEDDNSDEFINSLTQ